MLGWKAGGCSCRLVPGSHHGPEQPGVKPLRCLPDEVLAVPPGQVAELVRELPRVDQSALWLALDGHLRRPEVRPPVRLQAQPLLACHCITVRVDQWLQWPSRTGWASEVARCPGSPAVVWSPDRCLRGCLRSFLEECDHKANFLSRESSNAQAFSWVYEVARALSTWQYVPAGGRTVLNQGTAILRLLLAGSP